MVLRKSNNFRRRTNLCIRCNIQRSIQLLKHWKVQLNAINDQHVLIPSLHFTWRHLISSLTWLAAPKADLTFLSRNAWNFLSIRSEAQVQGKSCQQDSHVMISHLRCILCLAGGQRGRLSSLSPVGTRVVASAFNTYRFLLLMDYTTHRASDGQQYSPLRRLAATCFRLWCFTS